MQDVAAAVVMITGVMITGVMITGVMITGVMITGVREDTGSSCGSASPRRSASTGPAGHP